ncbi:MAG TPA: hypothetical protein PLH32_06150 [bacterium]|nr:hypothetical protein [bacterium]
MQRVLVLAGLLLAARCGGQKSTEPTPAKSDLVTFSLLKTSLFSPTCARSGCHGTTSTQANRLLTADHTYANLVDVVSFESHTLKRVKSFDCADSLLICKLNSIGTSIMPPADKLAQARIDSVAAWINRGAVTSPTRSTASEDIHSGKS